MLIVNGIGCQIVSLTGGVGGHIHNVGFSYAAMPWSAARHRMFSSEFKRIVKVIDVYLS